MAVIVLCFRRLLWSLLLLSYATWAERSNYGQTPYPIWSPLSYFERDTISAVRASTDASAETLLALSLIASGVRGSAEFERARTQLSDFYQQLDKLLVQDPDPWLTGKLINQRMHAQLLRAPDATPPGYALEQSRLQGIFEDGHYNCISSALLYAVIARHYDLAGAGVLLPSHAFVELNLPGGQTVDVETTSANGFDQPHDEAFYQSSNQQWFEERALQGATYEDYLARERVPFIGLATRNMLNQHTAKARMQLEDSLRLAEISAFLDPDYPLAQIKRLYFYTIEIQELIDAQDWASLSRLFDITYRTVLFDAARFPAELELQKSLQLYLAGAMLGYAHMGEVERTLEVMGVLLESDWSLSDSRAELESRVAHASATLINKLIEQQRFDDAQLMLSLVEGYIGNHPLWSHMTLWLYLRWAEHHWQAQRWEDVIFTLLDVQHLTHNSAGKQPLDMIEAAYYNWVLELGRSNKLDTATGVVEQCTVQISATQSCQKAQKLLRSLIKQSSRD